MKIQTDGTWLYCQSEHANKHNDSKLHAAIPISNFDTQHPRVYQLLKKAVEDGIIPAFKILNLGDGHDLSKMMAEDVTIDKDPHSRLFNNPFTIYLYEAFDSEQIMNLCYQIEEVLKYSPNCNRDHLSIADLDLTKHITFRKESLDGKYIKIAGASVEDLKSLKEQGEKTKEYQTLKSIIDGRNKKEQGEENKLANERQKNIFRFFIMINTNILKLLFVQKI